MAAPTRHARDPVPVRLSGADAVRGFTFTLWTNDPRLAARADAAGVDRVGVDLETLGKRERQAGRGTWISEHRVEELPALAGALRRSSLFARTDPLNPGSATQVERLLELGVEVLMLPMFRRAEEVAEYAALVGRRAHLVLLLETREALADLDAIVTVPGVDELHVGINDMALALGLGNRFEVIVGEAIERVAVATRSAGIPFGFGGLGRVGDSRLPIAPDLIYAQYARLGATAALVSRAFLEPDADAVDLSTELRSSRARLAVWFARPRAELDAARDALRRAAAATAVW